MYYVIFILFTQIKKLVPFTAYGVYVEGENLTQVEMILIYNDSYFPSYLHLLTLIK